MKKLITLLSTVNAVLFWLLWYRYHTGVWLFESIMWTLIAAWNWLMLETR